MLNLLVADDNPISVDFFLAALHQLGHAGTGASDGIDAVRLAAQQRYDLLLFDACMPELDGAAALRRIRGQAGPNRETVALATTATVDASRHAELLAAGFVAVLSKPLALADLAAAIHRHAPNDSSALTDIDEARAMAAVGGDAAIVAALRSLLLAELERLPAELADLAGTSHACTGLAERLHRLQASAGFCGFSELQRRARALEASVQAGQTWPAAGVAALVEDCEWIAARLRAAA